jgi:hypothetical protein
MAAWYDQIVDWATPYIDTAAEFINYEDIDYGIGTLSAGDQLVDDVSDAWGFVKQGAKAYTTVARLGESGKNKNRPFQPIAQERIRQSRTLGQMGLGSSKAGTNFQASQTQMGGVGYNNANVQTAMTALLANSYNSQMNQMLSQFGVPANIQQGRRTTTGSQSLNRKSKVATA